MIKKESPIGVLRNRQTFKIHMKKNSLRRGPFLAILETNMLSNHLWVFKMKVTYNIFQNSEQNSYEGVTFFSITGAIPDNSFFRG